MIVLASDSARAAAISLVPLAKSGISKTPTGPFHNDRFCPCDLRLVKGNRLPADIDSLPPFSDSLGSGQQRRIPGVCPGLKLVRLNAVDRHEES